MNRLYRLLKFNARLLAFSTLLIMASYVLLGRIALSVLPDYRHDLEQYLSEQAQTPVTIKSLHGKWRGFDPVIEVEGLNIDGVENAYIDTVSIHVSALKSFLALSPRFKSIVLDSSTFTLRQQQDGSWQVAGIVVRGEQSEQGQLLSLAQLFDGAHFTLNNNLFSVYDRNGRLRVCRMPTVSLNYLGDRVFASGQVLQPADNQPLLGFSYEGKGVLSGDKVLGILYLEARSSEFFDEVLKTYDWEDISVENVDASARMWVSFDGIRVSSVQGDFQVREVNWKAGEKSLPPLKNAAASFQWMDSGEQSELEIHWNGLSWEGQRCEPTKARIEISPRETRAQFALLDVQCLSQIALGLNLLPDDLQDRIEVSDPSGYLSNVGFTMNHIQASGKERFQFEAELNNVSVKPYTGTPGLIGIDGYILAGPEEGRITFDSARFELSFPELFLLPWKTKRTEGAVSWRLDGDDALVFSEGLRLRMPDNSMVYGDFILYLNPLDKEDYLGLSLGLQDIAFEDVTRYVPYYEVDEDLFSWLDRSLLKGQVPRGVYYGYGSIESDDSVNSFTTSLFVETQDGQLLFDEGWPKLSNLKTIVQLQNGEVDVRAETATIQDTKLADLVVQMPESEKDAPSIVNVKADVRANKETLQYWLNESPIAKHTSAIARQLKVRGEFDVALDIDVPIDSALPVGYEAISTLTDIEIEHIDSFLVFKHVQGQLGISSASGVFASDIKTELLGGHATLSIETIKEKLVSGKGNDKQSHDQIVLGLTGRASIEKLLQNYQMPAIDGLSGMFDFSSELRLPRDGGGYPTFSLSSDLLGVTQIWPAPFDKSPTEPASFELGLLIKPNQMYVSANIESEHAPGVDAELLFVGNEFSFGEVLIGGADSGSPSGKGLNVQAVLDDLILEPWIEFVQDITNTGVYQNGGSILEHLDIETRNLDAFDQKFQNTHAIFGRENARWYINLQGDEIAGKVLLPSGDSVLDLQLNHLHLITTETELADSQSNVEILRFDPRELTPMNFSSEQLFLNGKNYGAWSMKVEPNEQGAIFGDLYGNIDGTHINGQLNWRRLSDQLQNSILTIDVSGGNVQTFLEKMAWPPALTSDQFQAEIAFVWSDEPMSFELAKVSGSIMISMKDGALKTEDEKTGALRLFGILNAEAILRRLTLDFSDLYTSGISYDNLSVRATIDQGRLVLEEPLVIEGPSSSYTINGTADLTNKILDMDMLVELPFSQNVPLAALVLGAPAVGGAVWLIDKLMGEPLSAITTARYDITGSWEDPKVKMRQVLNASTKKRSDKAEVK